MAAIHAHLLSGQSRADLGRFEAVAHRVNRGDPNWVAPLTGEFEALVGAANPFWEHAELRMWIARRDGEDVGRIAAIRDEVFNRLHGGGTTLFGFFECIDDREVARVLFGAVCDWARDHGDRRVLGPMNPSLNDECGVLVDGYEIPPTVMTTHNPAYYPALFEAEGFRKAKDLLGFDFIVAESPIERFRKLGNRLLGRHPELKVRTVTRRTLKADVPRIRELYNAAWEENWGAIPFSGSELDVLVARLKFLLVDGLVWVAERGEEVVGIVLAVPDANEFLQPLRGRFWSRGLFTAAPYLLGLRRPSRVRAVILGTSAEFRGRGLEAALFAGGLERARDLGFNSCEASWILEDNEAMLRLIDAFGGRRSKTWRIYECEV